jgi:hypothetical protein
VVGHEAVAERTPAALYGEDVEEREKPETILRVEEDRLPPIASSGQVKGPAGELETRRSRHRTERRTPAEGRIEILRFRCRSGHLSSHVRGQTQDVAAVDALKLVVTLSGVL